MLRSIGRALLLRRMLEGSSRRRSTSYGWGSPYGRGRGRRGSSGGFGMRPFPSYSRRTRGGSRVTVTGCCLPIPLGIVALPATAYALHRRR